MTAITKSRFTELPPFCRLQDTTKYIYPFGRDSQKRVQLRLDAINVFNHPNFVFNSDAGGGTGFRGSKLATQSSISTLTTAEYNTWAQFNGQPLQSTTAGNAIYQQILGIITANRIPGTSVLPPNFFSGAVPAGFEQINPLSYDIRTLDGYKLYRLDQTWDTRFGTLSTSGEQPRLIQFSIRFTF
jgi:hypothetical protein